MDWRKGPVGMGVGVRRSLQLSELDDGALLALVRGGDRHAYGELYARYERQARMYARSLAGNGADADDAVAEVFVRLLEAIEHGRGPSDSFGGYLLASVRHECAHLARRSSRGTDAKFGDRTQPPAGDSDLATEVAEAAVVRAAFASLPDQVRHILLLTEIDQLPQSQVAARLEADQGTVAVRAMRARRALTSAYLDQHRGLSAHGGPRRRACNETQHNLVAYVRGTLASRRRVRTEAHLRACTDCRWEHDELQRLNTQLRTVGGWSLLAWIRTLVEFGRSAVTGAVAAAPAATTILAAAGMSLVVAPAPAGLPAPVSHRERALTSATSASVAMGEAVHVPLDLVPAMAMGAVVPNTWFTGTASVGGGPPASPSSSAAQPQRAPLHPGPLSEADTSPPAGSVPHADRGDPPAPSDKRADPDSRGRSGDAQGADKGGVRHGADAGKDGGAADLTDGTDQTGEAAQPDEKGQAKKSGQSAPSGQTAAAAEADASVPTSAAGRTAPVDQADAPVQTKPGGRINGSGQRQDPALTDGAAPTVATTVAANGSGPSDTEAKHGG